MRNEAAATTNGMANFIEKERRALHEAASQHDDVRGKKVDQVGGAEAEIEGFALDCPARELVSFPCHPADLFSGAIRIICGRLALGPDGHCWTSGQSFPASVVSAG